MGNDKRDTVKIRINGNIRSVVGGKFLDMKGIVKSIEGRMWESEDKVWNIPSDQYGALVTKLGANSFKIVGEDGNGEDEFFADNGSAIKNDGLAVVDNAEKHSMKKFAGKRDDGDGTIFNYPSKFTHNSEFISRLSLSGDIVSMLDIPLSPQEFAARVFYTIDHFRGKIAGKRDVPTGKGGFRTEVGSSKTKGSLSPKEASQIVVYATNYGILPWEPKGLHLFYFEGLMTMLHYQKIYRWADYISRQRGDNGFIIHETPRIGGGDKKDDFRQTVYLRPNINSEMWTKVFVACLGNGETREIATESAWQATSTMGIGILGWKEVYYDDGNIKNKSKKNWDYIADVLSKRAKTKVIFNHYGDLSPTLFRDYLGNAAKKNDQFSVVEEIKDAPKKLTLEETNELVHGPEDFEGID